MILTDREIQVSLEEGLIVIDPQPDESLYSSTSVDLTLDETLTEFVSPTPGLRSVLDPSDAKFNHETVLDKISKQITIGQDGYTFEPNRLILAWTKEYIKLKPGARLAARVEGKSSLARLGIGVHITAPTIHAGFGGQIRLEMMNHGVMPICLRSGMKICQLIFEQTVGTPVRGYKGRFFDQRSTTKIG